MCRTRLVQRRAYRTTRTYAQRAGACHYKRQQAPGLQTGGCARQEWEAASASGLETPGSEGHRGPR
jgi:hypothetical protein